MKMYNFFVTRVTKQICLYGVLFMPKQIIIQSSLTCYFCNFYHGKVSKLMHHQICTNTTILSPLKHSKIKKKVKRRTKKYAELLEVLNQITSNKRSTVLNAKVSDTVIIANQSDIITDKLHKIEDITCNKTSLYSENLNKDCHTSCGNKIGPNIGNKIGTLSNKEKVHKRKGKESTRDLKKVLLNVKADETMAMSKMKQTSQKGKMKSKNKFSDANTRQQYVENLLAYMQVYISCGMLNRANKTLMIFRNHMQDKFESCTEYILIYNILLEAYASKKDFNKVLELYDIMKTDSLILTPQTYAHIFYALGKTEFTNKQIELFTILKNEMCKNNISFNDILNKSYFKYNQRKTVLGIITKLEPHFKPLEDLENPLNIEYTHNVLKKTSMEKNYKSPVKGLLTIKKLKEAFKRQLRNESAIEIEIESIDTYSKNINVRHGKKLKKLETYWKETALAAFKRNVMYLKKRESHSYNTLTVLYPFFEVLDEEDYICAIIQEIRKLALGSETYSTCLKLLHIDLGKYIFKKYEIKMKKQTGVLDKIISIYHKYLDWYLNSENIFPFHNINNRTVWQYFEQEEDKFATSINAVYVKWSLDLITKIGKFLYDIILNDIILQPNLLKGHDVKCSIPAFYTLFRNRGNYLSEQIKPHPLVSKLYKELQGNKLTFNSTFIPSYSPSRPWTSIYTGGYILTKTDFVRIHGNKDSSWCKLENTKPQQLHPVFDSLNQLSSIPWTINTAILDILIQIFQNGGSVELNVPPSISVLVPPPTINKDASSEEKRNAAIAIANYKQKKDEMYSLWCDTLYKLSLANHFRDITFWLPHNLDFRGRVYPVPPHLNHLSSDLGRSLLLFANGKPLGPNGLDWLKLHVVNLTSLKKTSSIKERLKYANQNIENILDSATKPLTGKMWWAHSDEPWQTLAGCMEIANALKAPNVEEYKSKFPVHQDGSCNGLQHYAALGRDQIGAESINLNPFDTPKDVYSAVANLIEEQRQIDDKNGIKIAQLLKNHVKRRIIKQTVMTTVYGVTKYGAKLQIAKQLRNLPEKFPEDCVWYASIYLTEKTFHTLGTMFKSAREIQNWLTICAQIISSVYHEKVEWITPLGFPVVQPYTKQKKFLNAKQQTIPDTLKQKNAFAANFIHSLDSTHMMLTSLHCMEADITFVSVHDCFWTHACTVDSMNKICREQFIALHTETILEDLANFFIQHYKSINTEAKIKNKINLEQVHKNIIAVPKKGTFDINKVMLSTYFFS